MNLYESHHDHVPHRDRINAWASVIPFLSSLSILAHNTMMWTWPDPGSLDPKQTAGADCADRLKINKFKNRPTQETTRLRKIEKTTGYTIIAGLAATQAISISHIHTPGKVYR